MGLDYTWVLWNKQKKRYDRFIAIGMLSYLVLFFTIGFLTNPEMIAEPLIIRAFGALALLLLHIILVIGPLSRLNPKFLPLLYNRRHLGVSMFLAAFIHGVISIIQFHTLGDTNPIYSIFTENLDYGSLWDFRSKSSVFWHCSSCSSWHRQAMISFCITCRPGFGSACT